MLLGASYNLLRWSIGVQDIRLRLLMRRVGNVRLVLRTPMFTIRLVTRTFTTPLADLFQSSPVPGLDAVRTVTRRNIWL